MTDMASPSDARPIAPPAKTEGRIARALIGWLMRSATVSSIEILSDRFRLIQLTGDALREVAWTPGQKIQIKVADGLTARTYTPISWDAERGATRILVWSHGEGPASEWADALAKGDSCLFLGPRGSLDLGELSRPIVLFGDETSLGLAASIAEAAGRRTIGANLFEVTSADECGPVLNRLELGGTLVERRPGEAHLAQIETEILRYAADEDVRFVLSGKAQSVQSVSRALKASKVAPSRILAKAYWSPGKRGLD